MRGGRRDGAGRRPVEIDLNELEKLSMLHCTDKEIAGYLGCSVRTIESRRKTRVFREAMERGRAKGAISLRRIQFKFAEKKPGLAVWLGKQILNQRDVRELEVDNGAMAGKPREGFREEIDALLETAAALEESE